MTTLGSVAISNTKVLEVIEINKWKYVVIKSITGKPKKEPYGKSAVRVTVNEFERLKWPLAFRKNNEIVWDRRKVILKFATEKMARLIVEKEKFREEIVLKEDEIDAVARCDVNDIIGKGIDEVDRAMEKIVDDLTIPDSPNFM